MTDDGGRLVISDDDLVEAPGSTTSVPPPPGPPGSPGLDHAPPDAAQTAYPSVAGVKPAPLKVGAGPGASSPAPFQFGGTLTTNVIAGLVSILVAWVAVELFTSPDQLVTSESEAVGHTALLVGVLGLIFGALFSSWDKLTARLWEAALPQAAIGAAVGGIAGAISGAIAQSTYHSILVSVLKDSLRDPSSSLSPHDVRFYLARALAWAIFGVAIGAACAAAQRSARKLVNACLGGLAGGTVGGLFFHWLVASGTVHDATVARFLSFAVIGGGIGAAIGVIETARRQAWLKIVAGGMTGKEFIVYHTNANVGSSPKCEITLIKDPAIGPYHFRIDEQSGRRSLVPYDGCVTSVNGHQVGSHVLRNGDSIQVGSTTMQYAERAVGQ